MEIKAITFKTYYCRLTYDNNGVLMKSGLLFKLIKRYILLKIISLSIYMIYPN